MLNFHYLKFDYLKFEGNERLDLINRLSTNETGALGKFNCVKTILTTDKGRFVDLLTLYIFGDFVFCTCSPGNSENVIVHLDKYTIMDDFRAVNMSGTHEAILFSGNQAENFAKEVFNADSFTGNDFSVYSESGHDVVITRNDDSFGGFIFIYAAEDKNFWSKKIFEKENDPSEINDEQYEVMRIGYGIPLFGKEMTGLTNPLECGLGKYVSFTKGCYIGQEVIARLDAYDKINKHLVGFIAENPVKISGDIGQVKFITDNKECGFVTSSANSEKFGNIGLGFVKTLFLDYEKEYIIKNDDGSVKCKIVKLPFR